MLHEILCSTRKKMVFFRGRRCPSQLPAGRALAVRKFPACHLTAPGAPFGRTSDGFSGALPRSIATLSRYGDERGSVPGQQGKKEAYRPLASPRIAHRACSTPSPPPGAKDRRVTCMMTQRRLSILSLGLRRPDREQGCSFNNPFLRCCPGQ